jgi:hypothetical protein
MASVVISCFGDGFRNALVGLLGILLQLCDFGIALGVADMDLKSGGWQAENVGISPTLQRGGTWALEPFDGPVSACRSSTVRWDEITLTCRKSFRSSGEPHPLYERR